jgi:FkbM family methyltransferase
MWFYLAKTYSFLYGICHDHFGVNIWGMGFFMRRIKKERVVTVDGIKMFLNPAVASCYIRNLNGRFNEPETHVFFREIITAFREPLLVVDVGANIGEMVIDAARYPNVKEVVGFEPNPSCVEACVKSVALNQFRNVRIINKAVNADGKPVTFNFSSVDAVLSSLVASEDRHGEVVGTTTLDRELSKYNGPVLLLIDVEGAEKLVMQGAKNFIGRNLPVIIFEFNDQTRRFFLLEELYEVLGKGYSLFRLRGDGKLDRALKKTWNCVALHRESPLYAVCAEQIREQ